MKLSPEFRDWLLTVDRPDPDGSEQKAAEELVVRLEADDYVPSVEALPNLPEAIGER